VLLRIATLDGIQPAALRELDDVLTTLLSGSDNLKRSPMGGIRTAAEILNFMSSNARRRRDRKRARNTTRNSRRRSSIRCLCSRTCSNWKTARSSCC
jgi:flagellar motor switch protein FliG